MQHLIDLIKTLYEKIKTLSIMLFEKEQELKQLKEIIKQQDETIKDLNIDLYFSDLELKDMKFIMDTSKDVKYMHSLQNEKNTLNNTNNILSRLLNKDIFLC